MLRRQTCNLLLGFSESRGLSVHVLDVNAYLDQQGMQSVEQLLRRRATCDGPSNFIAIFESASLLTCSDVTRTNPQQFMQS